MSVDLKLRYDSSDEFFILGGSAVMKVSADAAIAICQRATEHGLVIARIEGGIWHAPGFEARLDCIWDGADPPVDMMKAKQNNGAAAEFVRSERDVHDAFVITAPRMTGW
ncbi:colicin immunity protein (plasmid) [Rhizobium beringeri]|jgi:hypothetical protein|uniref:colicin immunity protein n=1 Tax=Rhizobium beringeri TaxID=3019934 RepID=UPI002E14A393|nr:colicin immunity protein [Rhizobium beringeri]WSH54116.1 colicin immunity protein [Rhizobium beringeri]WSH84447.1 colicin immunity protein [Rhizobium beringeri]